MRKIALSLFVIAGSGAYVSGQWGKGPAEDLLGSALPMADAQNDCSQRRIPSAARAETTVTPQRVPTVIHESMRSPGAGRSMVGASLSTAEPAASHAMPGHLTRAAMTVAADASYADGAHTGPAVDAYYGLVQVQAIVQGGRIVGIKMLQYPSDRRTSVYINHRALPVLRDEVISAQSATVDIVSGATLTSKAFIRSLGAALRGQATT